MELLSAFRQHADLRVTENEILIINSALNEVCNGLLITEFDTRIGVTQDNVALLLGKIEQILDVIAASKLQL